MSYEQNIVFLWFALTALTSLRHRSLLTAHRSLSQLPRCNPFRSNIRLQRIGNHYTSIGLLVVLDDRNPGSSHRQAAAVQSVHEFCLILALRTIADICPPRLV